MKFSVDDLAIELAPLTRESMSEFVDSKHGGGLQRHSVSHYLNKRFAPVLEDKYEWFDEVRATEGNIVWGIWVVDGDERTVIGTTNLDMTKKHQSGPIRQATSASAIFRPDYWNKGIISACHKARLQYGFRQVGLHRITSTVVQGNHASRKTLLRSGYTFTHTERNQYFVDGKLRHLDHFECLNPLELFWEQWWHGEDPTETEIETRQEVFEVMRWAKNNVELA